MTIKTAWTASLFGAFLLSASIPASGQTKAGTQESAFMGYWLSQGHDGVFRIGKCGETVCGQLVGLSYQGDDVPRDYKGRSECGLQMLTDFRQSSDDGSRWNGKILDPDSGRVYQAQIWSPQKDVLKLRGYIGLPLFGETQTWTRYRGTLGPVCKMP
ncbi:DUF2147 domain-containing protein [Acetobacter farinalis]|uniref:DUF2147 domain-containing protein n=1 Tax=Acetobacter farinalis TaxID=1260984 RepID=A0ABT3Q4U5_9PROT|nr:DUF2147 domain-containing protein [Acetobacter farinalis]